MIKKILIAVMFIAMCGSVPSLISLNAAGSGTKADLEAPLSETDTFQNSYYAAQGSSAFEFFKRSRVQEFLAMWVKEETGDIESPEWNYDSFAQIQIIDHDLKVSRPEERLYYCTFSDGADRQGYIIIKYNEAESSMSNWDVTETTPYVYDLRTNMEKIRESLMKTDIDLSTAKASRIYLFDKDKNRADQAVRFTDGKGDNYICFFGSESFEVKKW